MKNRYKILLTGVVIIVLILFILPIVITLGSHWYCDMINPRTCMSWSISPFGIIMIQSLFCEIEDKKWDVYFSTCYEPEIDEPLLNSDEPQPPTLSEMMHLNSVQEPREKHAPLHLPGEYPAPGKHYFTNSDDKPVRIQVCRGEYDPEWCGPGANDAVLDYLREKINP